MALRGIGTGRKRRHLNAEVNIINLVDVVLVLLLIFMLTAPMLQGGVEVRLPRAAARPLEARDGLTITVTSNGDIAIGEQRLTWAEFRSNIGTVVRLDNPEGVYIRGDAAAPYGEVVRVLAAVRAAGVTNVGMVVEPESER
jgi:biopolymer transport protein ExbD/biopolymer transport protein TolR